MSREWRAYAPVRAALLHDHFFKQLRRHPAAKFRNVPPLSADGHRIAPNRQEHNRNAELSTT
jgi:hypothetical protein